MQIQRVSVSKIKPAPYNPRVDLQPGDPKYESLKRGIEQFGCVEPLAWNARSGNLVGGHQSFKILQEQGAEQVAISVVDLPEEQKKALNIALNKLDGEWDDAKLAALLDEFMTLNQFDIELTGFDLADVNELIASVLHANTEYKDEDFDIDCVMSTWIGENL
jgi:ParB-like chromosome segregation protein Spo0J